MILALFSNPLQDYSLGSNKQWKIRDRSTQILEREQSEKGKVRNVRPRLPKDRRKAITGMRRNQTLKKDGIDLRLPKGTELNHGHGVAPPPLEKESRAIAHITRIHG